MELSRRNGVIDAANVDDVVAVNDVVDAATITDGSDVTDVVATEAAGRATAGEEGGGRMNGPVIDGELDVIILENKF